MHPLVVALNPSVDVEWQVASVHWEEKNEVLLERRWPGGKGVNVARWLKHLGSQPRLLLPLGGRHGEELTAGLAAERIATSIVPIAGSSRANVIVTGASQGQLRFNPLGPEISGPEWRAIQRAFVRELPRASLVILSGSLPRGLSPNTYAELVRLARRHNRRVVLDCEGPALAAALSAQPFLVKPNHHELDQWAGHKPGRRITRTSTVATAHALAQMTRGCVLVSQGPDGASLLGSPSGDSKTMNPLSARAPRVRVLNTVGAGDALVAAAALQISNEAEPADWLRWGVAAGTAATTQIAGQLPSAAAIRRLTARTTVREIK